MTNLFSTVILPEIFERKMFFELKLECIIQCLVGEYILMHFSDNNFKCLIVAMCCKILAHISGTLNHLSHLIFSQQMLIFFPLNVDMCVVIYDS